MKQIMISFRQILMAWCHVSMSMVGSWCFKVRIFEPISLNDIKIEYWFIVFNILRKPVMTALNLA